MTFFRCFTPRSVEAVHRSYLEAGADVIETNTFRSNPFTLAEYGLAERCEALNLASARLARKLADEYTNEGKQRFLAGSMGPTGILLSMPDQNPRQVTFRPDYCRLPAAGKRFANRGC